MADNGRTWGLRGVTLHSEGHRATTAELLWDLVYVFAATQVTALMTNTHSVYGVLQGMLVLGLLWWTWVGYAWMGNRAHGGVLRAGSLVAMAAVFVMALTIREAWEDLPGGLDGPVVFVCAYVVVRAINLVLSVWAAAGDAGMRRQVRLVSVTLVIASALLVAGALLGGWRQTVLFTLALFVDWGVDRPPTTAPW